MSQRHRRCARARPPGACPSSRDRGAQGERCSAPVILGGPRDECRGTDLRSHAGPVDGLDQPRVRGFAASPCARSTLSPFEGHPPMQCRLRKRRRRPRRRISCGRGREASAPSRVGACEFDRPPTRRALAAPRRTRARPPAHDREPRDGGAASADCRKREIALAARRAPGAGDDRPGAATRPELVEVLEVV